VAARPLESGQYEFEITITEGRKREVRRLCKALGLHVQRLTRVRFGPVELGNLRVGESRPLTQKELHALARLTEGS
jgi:pseudouridine synthase